MILTTILSNLTSGCCFLVRLFLSINRLRLLACDGSFSVQVMQWRDLMRRKCQFLGAGNADIVREFSFL
jgi:hypothetical protein